MTETRNLAAILVTDVVGYSRLAGADEDRTFARLRGLSSDLIDPAIAAHRGRIVKRTGDGSIIEFRSISASHFSDQASVRLSVDERGPRVHGIGMNAGAASYSAVKCGR
jgi:class 3 adenylate cyclase